MPVIHVMTGLPASGKTTAARRILAEGKGRIRRVNLDDLRAMLDDSEEDRVWSRKHERTVLEVQDVTIKAILFGGFSVVVDNTHLTPNIPSRIKLAAVSTGLESLFRVHDFTGVTIKECIRRDAARKNPVGEKVIRGLAERHIKAMQSGWKLTESWLNERS